MTAAPLSAHPQNPWASALGSSPTPIRLTAIELLYLSGALGRRHLVGIQDPFRGWLTDEIETALDAAETALADRHWIVAQADRQIIMDTAVAALVGTVAGAEQSFIQTLAHPGAQAMRSQWLYYGRSPLAVEAHLEPDGQYALTPLAGPQAILTRVLDSWAFDAHGECDPSEVHVPETVFRQAQQLASPADAASESLLRSAGLPPVSAKRLARDLAAARATGTLIRVSQRDGAWRTVGLGVVEGPAGCWRLRRYERQDQTWIEALACTDAQWLAEVHSLVLRPFSQQVSP